MNDSTWPDSNTLWRVRLLDGPLLESASGNESRRFRSQKIGALLAYLALRLGRPCPREELCVALWPDENDALVVANRLRVALASLRRQLEPPGVPFGAVLDVSNAGLVCLRQETVWCDADAIECAFRAGRKTEAASLLTGTLLPGYYEEWIELARARFDTLRERLAEAVAANPAPETALVAPVRVEPRPALYPLPLYLTRFFGRDAEKKALLELLCQHRLVTLVGPGGMGKTRLAIETARQHTAPTVFAALADVTEGAQIPGAALRAMAVLPAVQDDLTAQLIAIFNRREPVLLVLDNAEHLIADVADFALRLLAGAPELSLLVTSRQSLNLAGEAVLPVAPLANPCPETPDHLLADIPAVALFLDRARKARPDFTLAPRYTEAMRQICAFLEGVPLALELAAARVVMQTPAQIAGGLAFGLLRLQSHQRGFSPRHRSLRASIQGSYDLLSPELQRFFVRLSIFQGGWTPEAARFVTDCETTEAFLEELAQRSLLVTEEHAARGVMRCGFLESIRQFAAERLTDAERDLLSLRHAEYFLTLAAGVSEDDIQTLLPLDAEQENLLVALEVAQEKKTEMFPSGLIGAFYHAYIRGYNRLFLGWVERSLAIGPLLPDIRERCRLGIAQYLILSYVGRYALVEEVGRAMQRDADAHHFAAGSAVAKLILSYIACQRGDYGEAMRLSGDALREARQTREKPLLYRVLRLVGWYRTMHATKTAGIEPDLVRTLLLESKALCEECLTILPPRSSQITFAQRALSEAVFALGDAKEGYALCKAAQKTAIAQGMDVMLIFCYQNECMLALKNAQFDFAALLYGAHRGLREKTDFASAESAQEGDALEQTLKGRLGNERFEALARRGEQTPHEVMATLSLDHIPPFILDFPL